MPSRPGSLYDFIKAGDVKVHNRSPTVYRFWKNVDKDGPVHHRYGKCWVWVGYKREGGYGVIVDPKRGRVWAHRFSFEIHNSVSLGDLCALHKCDNPSCVRPDHLFSGTRGDNNRDRHIKGRNPPGHKGSKNKGEENGQAVLTWEVVGECRKRYRFRCPKNGAGPLSKEFGVSPTAILAAVRYRTWKTGPET